MARTQTARMEPTDQNMVSLKLRLTGHTVHEADVIVRGIEFLKTLGYGLVYQDPTESYIVEIGHEHQTLGR